MAVWKENGEKQNLEILYDEKQTRKQWKGMEGGTKWQNDDFPAEEEK